MTLYIFDLDGTLISSYMNEPGKPYHKWHVLPGRVDRLAAVLASGDRVAIATNQAGVAFGLISESAARRKVALALEALALPPETPVAMCFAHPNSRIYRYRTAQELARRKPRGTMLRELAAAEGNPRRVVYVGDRNEDKDAARDAAVSFRWADEYFAGDGV